MNIKGIIIIESKLEFIITIAAIFVIYYLLDEGLTTFMFYESKRVKKY